MSAPLSALASPVKVCRGLGHFVCVCARLVRGGRSLPVLASSSRACLAARLAG